MLYGMISAIGVRNVVENKVDLTKSKPDHRGRHLCLRTGLQQRSLLYDRRNDPSP